MDELEKRFIYRQDVVLFENKQINTKMDFCEMQNIVRL